MAERRPLVIVNGQPAELPAADTVPLPKASRAEAEAGTDDTKVMTPLKTAQAIAALGALGLIFNPGGSLL